MDICFNSINIKKKKRIHFQEFMIDIHNRLHEKRKSKNINYDLLNDNLKNMNMGLCTKLGELYTDLEKTEAELEEQKRRTFWSILFNK